MGDIFCALCPIRSLLTLGWRRSTTTSTEIEPTWITLKPSLLNSAHAACSTSAAVPVRLDVDSQRAASP